MKKVPIKIAKLIRRLILWLVVVFLLLVLLGFLFPGHHLGLGGYRVQSQINITTIARVMQSYRQDHEGHTPERLSQLVDLVKSSPNWFFLNCKYVNGNVSTNKLSQQDVIDRFSPYLFTALNDKRVLVYEAPNMWKYKYESVGYCLMSANPSNTEPEEVGRFSPSDFAARFQNGFKEMAVTSSVWQVQYRVDGAYKGYAQISEFTSAGSTQKTVLLPYTSPIYQFCKYQRAGISSRNIKSPYLTLLINGRMSSQRSSSGDEASINWIVGSDATW